MTPERAWTYEESVASAARVLANAVLRIEQGELDTRIAAEQGQTPEQYRASFEARPEDR